MNDYLKTLICGIAALLVSTSSLAGSSDAIEAAFKKLMPNFKVTDIRPSPVSGMSEVMVGPRLFYVTDDGKYLFQGSLIDIANKKDVSAQVRQELRLDAVNSVGMDNMIVFPAREERHQITVFTDIDCGYCRKLHNEVAALNASGVTVRYLMFPRSGPRTPSFEKAISVWCAEDRQGALTRAKRGEQVEAKSCENPMMDHYRLGGLLGVEGTPAIVLDDGELVPGYVPARELTAELNKRKTDK